MGTPSFKTQRSHNAQQRRAEQSSRPVVLYRPDKERGSDMYLADIL